MINKFLITYDTTFEAYKEVFLRKNPTIAEVANDIVWEQMSPNDKETNSLLHKLQQAGVEIVFIRYPYQGEIDPLLEKIIKKCQEADLIFHTSSKAGKLQCQNFEWLQSYQKKLQDLVTSKFLNKTSFFGTVHLLTKKEQFQLALENDIPMPVTAEFNKLNNIKFPLILKKKISWRAQENYFFDSKDQLDRFFDDELNKLCLLKRDKKNYIAQEFVVCPSSRYTTYRIFTMGNGNIIGGALFVSYNKKSEQKRIAFPVGLSYEDTLQPSFIELKEKHQNEWITSKNKKEVYNNVFSPLYMGFYDIFSNSNDQDTEIPIEPSINTKYYLDEERETKF